MKAWVVINREGKFWSEKIREFDRSLTNAQLYGNKNQQSKVFLEVRYAKMVPVKVDLLMSKTQLKSIFE